MAPKLPDRRRRYTDEQVDRALTALALNHGSARRAVRDLAGHGLKVAPSTLVKWSDVHMERYAELQARVVPEIEAKLVESFRENASLANEAQRLAIETLTAELQAGKLTGPEAAKAAQAMGIVGGIDVDKLSILTGRPSEIVEHRDAQAMLRELGEIAPGLIYEGTGVEIDVRPLLPPGNGEHGADGER